MNAGFSKDCAEFCPIAQECGGINGALISSRNSLAVQNASLYEAEEYGRQADIEDALSILAGEVTADESEGQASIPNPFEEYVGMDTNTYIAKSREETETEYTKIGDAQDALSKVFGLLALARADCEGPKSGFANRLKELKADLSLRLSFITTSPDMRETIEKLRKDDLDHLRKMNQFGSRKCTQENVRKAYKNLRKTSFVSDLGND